MKRLIVILTVAAMMVAMMAVSAVSASAQASCESWQDGYRWCQSSDGGWYKDYDGS